LPLKNSEQWREQKFSGNENTQKFYKPIADINLQLIVIPSAGLLPNPLLPAKPNDLVYFNQ
jgi:hypothetical protein